MRSDLESKVLLPPFPKQPLPKLPSEYEQVFYLFILDISRKTFLHEVKTVKMNSFSLCITDATIHLSQAIFYKKPLLY